MQYDKYMKIPEKSDGFHVYLCQPYPKGLMIMKTGRSLVTVLVAMAALAALFTGCGRNRSSVRSVVADMSLFAPEIQYVDSLRYLTVEPSQLGAMGIDDDINETSWYGFADLYTQRKFDEAYQFVMENDNYANILLYLKNSTAQYQFINVVLSPLMRLHIKDDAEYYREVEGALTYNLFTLKQVIVMGGDNPYIPPHYLDLVLDLEHLYLEEGDLDKAEANITELAFACEASNYNPIATRLLCLDYRCNILRQRGKVAEARTLIKDFSDEILPLAQSDEELQTLAGAIRNLERHLQ